MQLSLFMLISDMKKFILKIVLFFLVLAIIDLLLGKVFRYAYQHAVGGYTERYHYIYSGTHEDALVFGSSRALDNFVPDTIEKYLKMSCYDCGEDACGILLTYPRLNIIKKRYQPKVVIYDLYYSDFEMNPNIKTFTSLKPYYKEKSVSELYNRMDGNLKFKMLSNLYIYNSEFITYVADNIHRANYFKKGQYILGHTVTSKDILVPSKGTIQLDTLKLYYFEKFIRENKNKIAIYFTISPSYKGKDERLFKSVLDICRKYDMPVFNHYSDTIFTNHHEYFMDPNHLNMDGAAKFTQTIAKQIVKYNDSKRK